jgi:RimJ/RimL family protein N-acetyltransferase
VLHTPRLVLRPLADADATTLTDAALESLSDLLPWMGWAHPLYGTDDAEAWIAYAQQTWAENKEFCFGVFAGDRYLGNCGIDRIDWTVRSANLGYWIRSSAVGAGYAAEAAGALAAWAFRVHRLHRIEVVVMVGNQRSERTALRLGATREGVARNRVTLHGQPRDATVFSLIPGDRPPGAT